MGLNSYMTYTMTLGMGPPWQNSLACVFTYGRMFMLLNVFRASAAHCGHRAGLRKG